MAGRNDKGGNFASNGLPFREDRDIIMRPVSLKFDSELINAVIFLKFESIAYMRKEGRNEKKNDAKSI